MHIFAFIGIIAIAYPSCGVPFGPAAGRSRLGMKSPGSGVIP